MAELPFHLNGLKHLLVYSSTTVSMRKALPP